MTEVLAFAREARKFLIAVGGVAAVAVSSGLLSGTTGRWVTDGIAAVIAFLVYFIKNETPPAP